MASGSAMSAPSTFTLRLFSGSGKRWSRRTTCAPAVVIEPLVAVSVRPPFSCRFRQCRTGACCLPTGLDQAARCGDCSEGHAVRGIILSLGMVACDTSAEDKYQLAAAARLPGYTEGVSVFGCEENPLQLALSLFHVKRALGRGEADGLVSKPRKDSQVLRDIQASDRGPVPRTSVVGRGPHGTYQ
jgi:hypothetical protein